MQVRVFLFLIGFGISILGFAYIISYLNLLTMGYNFWGYVNFIIRRVECLNAIIGISLILISIYMGGKENELYI